MIAGLSEESIVYTFRYSLTSYNRSLKSKYCTVNDNTLSAWGHRAANHRPRRCCEQFTKFINLWSHDCSPVILRVRPEYILISGAHDVIIGGTDYKLNQILQFFSVLLEMYTEPNDLRPMCTECINSNIHPESSIQAAIVSTERNAWI